MKKILLILSVLCSLSAMAQDVIVKQNGDEIQCKILEVNKNEVKYKRWTNQDGPSFAEKKSEIFMIKYENGEKDMIAHSSPVSESSAVSSGMNSVDPNEYIFEEPTPISYTYLKYTTRGRRESGLIKWGNMLPEEQAMDLLNHDWLDFKKARKESRVGKILTWVGGSMVVASIPIVSVHISKFDQGKGDELIIPIAGFVGLGIPTIVIGRRLHKRGHKNATQIVDKYIEAYENGKKNTGMAVPEFSINSNGNNIAFTVTF